MPLVAARWRLAGLLGLFLILLLLVSPVAVAVDKQALVAGLIEAQTRVVERTREYRASLEQVLGFQAADVERADAQARSRRGLLERGIVSRRELEESERLRQAALSKLEQTLKRMAEADALMSETLATIELAKMLNAAQAELVTTPAVIRYQGGIDLAAAEVSNLETFFLGRFGRSLPVSAWGQTPVHDRLGLDPAPPDHLPCLPRSDPRRFDRRPPPHRPALASTGPRQGHQAMTSPHDPPGPVRIPGGLLPLCQSVMFDGLMRLFLQAWRSLCEGV